MKVIIDARESGSTTGRYIDKLIEYIAKINPDLEINIVTKPCRVEYIKKIAPKYPVVVADIKEFTFAEQLAFLRLLRSLKADLMHFGMTQQPVLYSSPTVTTMHDLTMTKKEFSDPNKNWLVVAIKRRVYKWVVVNIAARKSRVVIVPTDYVKKDLMKFSGQPAEKFVVTYEAADKIKDNALVYNKLENKRFLMYTGRPMPHKNLRSLIQAFELLQVKYPGLYLALAGPKDNNYMDIERWVRETGIKNVVFTGWISDGELRWMYENCAAYVFPSLSEGFGLPGLEAMVHGAPVVSSNSTCLPEVYGDAVKYFDPRDIDDMADAISEVLSNDKLRQELIKKGHRQVEKYSWKRMAEQTIGVYRKVLGS